MLTAFARSARHGVGSALRKPGDLLTPPAFFALAASLFPMGVGSDPALLARIAPGVLWVGALLAALLGLHRLFEPGYADGTLEQLFLSPQPVLAVVAGRIAAHWLTAGLPLVLLAPLLALQYGVAAGGLAVLCGGLLLGTPVLSLLGAIGAALALGGNGGSVLVALILMPLYVPVLILGAGALSAWQSGADASPHLMLLGALACAALALAPWAATAALRVALE